MSSGVDERGLDSHLAQRHLQLRVGAAVQQAAGDDVVARAEQRQDRRQLRGHPTRGGQAGTAAFQRGQTFLQHRHGRVADPRVHVAERFQVEQARRVIGESNTYEVVW